MKEISNKKYDAVLVTVAHREFKKNKFSRPKKEETILYDRKLLE